MVDAPITRYRFGEFVLDTDRAELLKGGKPRSLRPKAFDALAYLVRKRGRIATKDELIEVLWPKSVVTDDSLVKCVQEIRSALADDRHQYIKTLPRRGYLFDADVSAEPRAQSRTASARLLISPKLALMTLAAVLVIVAVVVGRNWLGTGTQAQGAVMPKSVAVLPLVNLSPNPDDAYFAAGIHDSILNQLVNIGDINTIARTSMLRYAGTEKSVGEIARELNVETVLEGSVRYADGYVRVTAQLIDPTTGMHLWSEEYDRPLADVFAIQTDIASRIATALRAELSPEERAFLGGPPGQWTEATELYLRGRYHWDKTTQADIRKAIDYYEQAVRAEPGFARAYAGIADAYTMLNGIGAGDPGELTARARAAAEQALALDPSLAEAYVARAMIKHFYDWDYEGGNADFERAIELNPNLALAHHLYGKNLPATLQFDDAIAELRRALELDPFSAAINKDLAETLYYQRRFDEAFAQFLRTLEIDPGSRTIEYWLVRAHESVGNRDETIAAHLEYSRSRGLLPDAPRNGRDVSTRLLDVYRDSGWAAYWLAWYQLIQPRIELRYFEPYRFVEAFARAGDLDRAFEWLERCFEVRSAWVPTILFDPVLDPLRADPRFFNFLERAGLDVYIDAGA